MTDTTSLREPMTPQYMAEVVQAAIETLCANGFQSRTHRLCEVRDQLRAARAEPQAGERWAADDFYSGHPLPKLHDDPAVNAEILIQALTARLDTARQALAAAAAMQVVQPEMQKIKANAAWAMDETDPRRVLPRSATYAAAPSPASRARPEAQGEAVLWCMHIEGPDDVHPAPSREHAQKAADLFNKTFAESDVRMHAKAAPWPHSAASHAEDVGDFIATWLLPRWQVEAADGFIRDKEGRAIGTDEPADRAPGAVGERRPTDAAIAREFWKRWTSTDLRLEAAHELQRLHDAALTTIGESQ